MLEDYSLSGYSSDQQNDRFPIWKPKETKPAAKGSVVLGTPAPAGSCKFVGDFPFLGCTSKLRLCQIDGCSCTFACYSDSKVWSKCWTRLEKLKDKEQT
jgi:hypothetical protein